MSETNEVREILVGGIVVSVCCDKLSGLLPSCTGVFMSDGLAPARLAVRIDKGAYSGLTPIFYCPYCGEKIVVEQVEEE